MENECSVPGTLHFRPVTMEPETRRAARTAKFIHVGAGFQFLLIFMLIIPPVGRWVNTGFLAIDSVFVREAISGIVLVWILISPILGTIFYKRLPLEQKAGLEGY